MRLTTFNYREVYFARRMQRCFCVRWTADNRYILSGSDDTNVRLWKATAWEQLGARAARERGAIRYGDKLISKFSHHPEVRRIAKSVDYVALQSFVIDLGWGDFFPFSSEFRTRNEPRPIKLAKKEKRVMAESKVKQLGGGGIQCIFGGLIVFTTLRRNAKPKIVKNTAAVRLPK